MKAKEGHLIQNGGVMDRRKEEGRADVIKTPKKELLTFVLTSLAVWQSLGDTFLEKSF